MMQHRLAEPSAKSRILLVEDDALACELYASALRMEGFQVRTALDGLAAVRLAETFNPDVVILDLKLPMADGFEVLEELRSMQCHQPVIAVSGYEPGIAAARRNPEFFAALQKPFDPDDLIGVARRAAHACP